MLMVAGLLKRSHGDIVVGGKLGHEADHRRRHRLPGPPAARVPHRDRQRHAARGHPRPAAEDDRGAREGAVRAAPADAGDAQVSAPALRRHAPARLARFARWCTIRPLLLMDEPFGALDALTRLQVRTDLEALWLRRRPDGALHHAQRRGGGRPLRPHPRDEPEPRRGRRRDPGRSAAAAADRARRRPGIRRLRRSHSPAVRAPGRAARHRAPHGRGAMDRGWRSPTKRRRLERHGQRCPCRSGPSPRSRLGNGPLNLVTTELLRALNRDRSPSSRRATTCAA